MDKKITIVDGDLIKLAFEGEFDVIVHGCNCFCIQASGIAWEMSENFYTDKYTRFPLEGEDFKGDINKLGNIQHITYKLDVERGELMSPEEVQNSNNKKVTGYLNFSKEKEKIKDLTVVNAYTQYSFGRENKVYLDYDALRLCMRKINNLFEGLTIGLPKIGCGLAKGSWIKVKSIIKEELTDCNVVIVNYKK